MSAAKADKKKPARPLRWRYFVQFSLRTLLMAMTAAAVACWWFLQPQVREEQLGSTPLRLRRQIRVVEFDRARPPRPYLAVHVESLNGRLFRIVNSGKWRVFDARGNILVDGRYVDDKEHGKWTTYHANGRRAAEGLMVHGVRSGRWRTWDEDGRLLSDEVYPVESSKKQR